MGRNGGRFGKQSFFAFLSRNVTHSQDLYVKYEANASVTSSLDSVQLESLPKATSKVSNQHVLSSWKQQFVKVI